MQPGESAGLLIQGIDTAKKSVEIVIFRFDRRDIERALKSAVSRGVFTHALIAHTNRGGEAHLRRLEMRLLEAGGTVARTADDLLRYHYKMIIIDRRVLYLLAFNFTYLDIEHSRSFGVITRNRKFVQEAVKLFEADTRRQPYTPGLPDFLVSPTNARKQLSSFISGAKKQLLIYDLKISDRAMIRLLEDRARSGVDVRMIGRLTRRGTKLPVRKLPRHAAACAHDDQGRASCVYRQPKPSPCRTGQPAGSRNYLPRPQSGEPADPASLRKTGTLPKCRRMRIAHCGGAHTSRKGCKKGR